MVDRGQCVNSNTKQTKNGPFTPRQFQFRMDSPPLPSGGRCPVLHNVDAPTPPRSSSSGAQHKVRSYHTHPCVVLVFSLWCYSARSHPFSTPDPRLASLRPSLDDELRCRDYLGHVRRVPTRSTALPAPQRASEAPSPRRRPASANTQGKTQYEGKPEIPSVAAGKPLSYWDYLGVEQLLHQDERSPGLPRTTEHDEALFITVHQVFEVWFKQMLHDLELGLFRGA